MVMDAIHTMAHLEALGLLRDVVCIHSLCLSMTVVVLAAMLSACKKNMQESKLGNGVLISHQI